MAFAERDGRFRGLAITDRNEPIDLPFQACLEYLGAGAAAAVAYLDERVDDADPTPEFIARFERLAALAASFGVVLVDWISCDDEQFRPARFLHAGSEDDWWDL